MPRSKIFVMGAALLVPVACASDPPPSTLADVSAAVEGDGVVERFIAATEYFLGTEYVNGPLGEGEVGGPDPDPRVDFARADCVTYLEQSLAVALAAGEEEAEFLRILDAVRYRDGRVSFADRNHYMVADWIPANEWLLEDVTEEIAPELTETVERTIDRASFLRDQGAEPRDGIDDPRTYSIEIVPRDALDRVAGEIRTGDLVFWVGHPETIFVVHTGLAVRTHDGDLRFRHGSSKAGVALDESLAEYAERATFAAGFIVLRLRDDAAWPRAGSPE